jgi:hypothetical protein
MEPSDFYDAPLSKVLHFILSVGLTKGLSKGKHKRSVMVVVQRPDVAHPSYIHTYFNEERLWRSQYAVTIKPKKKGRVLVVLPL